MEEFHGLLTFETSTLPESDPEKETLPDAVRRLEHVLSEPPPAVRTLRATLL